MAELRAGNFYGAVRGKRECGGAIFTDLVHTSPRKLPAHSHELPFVAVLLDGNYGERYGRQEKQFTAFTTMYRPAGVPHQDEIGPRGVKFFEIEILPKWQKSLADCAGTLETACEDVGGGQLLWLGLKLFYATRDPQCDEITLESLLAELMGVLSQMPRERAVHPPYWLRRVLEKIRADYAEKLTLTELSQEAGVHPVHLSRVFRHCVGMGLGEYIHRLRLREACERMLRQDQSICEISHATGFSDQSHFTRSFYRFAGTSPGKFRAML
jgi:AraC family transcriptional regulator